MTLSRSLLLLAVAACCATAPAPAQNCAKTSTGMIPINDLGPGTYRSFEAGLYPGGQNAPPATHAAAGLARAAAVQPLDAQGNPSPLGKIGLLSIGMSNTSGEFSTWIPISNADPRRSPAVVPVNGAQGGQSARIIADPNAPSARAARRSRCRVAPS